MKSMIMLSFLLLIVKFSFSSSMGNSSNSSQSSLLSLSILEYQIHRENLGYLESFDYPDPDNITSCSSDELLDKVRYAMTPTFNDYESYHSNNCTDDRIPSLYGSDLYPEEYKEICVSLIYDWSQVFTNYTCNKRFCNFHGLCSSTIDDSGFVTPSCNCEAGYNGQTCMFSSTNYNYTTNWLKALETWVLNKTYNTSSLNDSDSVSNLIEILGSLFYFTSNVNVKDLDYFGQITSKIFSVIINSSKIGGDPSLNIEILKFIEVILSATDSSFNGFDLSEIYRYCDSDYESSKFGSYSKKIDPNSALIIAPSGSNKRFLTSTNSSHNPAKKTESIPVNEDSPSLYIPQSAVSLMDPIFKISFTFVRDPKPFNQLNGPTIMSQIVTSAASSGKTTLFDYPQRAERMIITIPWSIVPYNNINYESNCKVYSYNKKNWVVTNSCIVESASNKTTASISCNWFGTYGVACVGSQAKIPKRSSSSEFIQTSSLLIAIIIFLFY
jgi:hypothetical protein